MTTFLGIDAGGTRTVVLLANGDRQLSRAVGGPGALRPGRALASAARIAATARQALTAGHLLQADLLVIGAAGAGREPERTELRESLRNERLAGRVIVLGDLDIALEAALGSKPGVIVISGTGSVAAAKAPDGTTHRRGGYGWQLGDEGSGFAIGRAGLIAVTRAHDGRGPATALTDALLRATPTGNFDALVRWSGTADPTEIAALAQPVFLAAAGGDPVARSLVAQAAGELAQLAQALLPLFGPRKPVPLALAGGNLAAGRGLREPLLEQLRAMPRFAVREAAVDPAEGALAIARRLAGSAPSSG